MMCFLYDEQFPVLPDIIQISGPHQSNHHLRHNQCRWRTKDPSDELAFILFHNLEVLEIYMKGDYIPTLFVSNEQSNNKRDKRDWESKIDLSRPTNL